MSEEKLMVANSIVGLEERWNFSSATYLSVIKNTYQKKDINFLSNIKFLFGTSYLLFFSLNEKNITRAIDLNGKKIAIVVGECHDLFDSSLKYFSQQNNVSIIPQLVHKLEFLSFDCVWGKPTDYYDVIVSDSYRIQETLMRLSRTLTSKEDVDWNRWQFITELTIPVMIKYTDPINTEISLRNNINSYMNEFIVENMKKDSFTYNYYQLQYKFGNGFFTNLDEKFINFYLEGENLQYFKMNETIKLDPIYNGTLQSLDNVICYNQGLGYSSICGDTELISAILGFEITNHIVLFIGVVYYLSLLTVCKTNTIKRRLLTPYILPLLIMFNSDFYSAYTNYKCNSLRMVFIIGSTAFIEGMYGFTLIRFYYLRNLYYILKKVPEKYIKFNKFLSSTGFGIVASLIVGLVHAAIWTTYVIVYHFPRERLFLYSSDVSFMSLFLVLSISACLFGIIFMGIDMAVNWRNIKSKGFVHFLTFEDPYHVRLDILSYAGITICILIILLMIAFVRGPSSYMYQGILRAIAFILVYFLSGWTAVISEWIGFVKRKRRREVSQEVKGISDGTPFEDLLKIDTFFEMFKSFSEKEFSLENSMLYERLRQIEIQCNGCLVSGSEIESIYQTFFKPYAKYEVNVSYRSKKDVEALLLAKIDVPFNDLKSMIEFDLMMTMKDTFERLRMTGEYHRWTISKNIQSMQSI